MGYVVSSGPRLKTSARDRLFDLSEVTVLLWLAALLAEDKSEGLHLGPRVGISSIVLKPHEELKSRIMVP